MKPTSFDYKKSLIKRRIWIKAVFIAACLALLGFDGAQPYYFTLLYISVVGYYAYKLVRDLFLLFRSAPAITISDEGVRDAHFGDSLIPWTAITTIKTANTGKTFGSMIVLIAEASQLEISPGPFTVRFANWVRGAKPGAENKQMAFPMTVTIALDAKLDDLLTAIHAHSPEPIEIQNTR